MFTKRIICLNDEFGLGCGRKQRDVSTLEEIVFVNWLELVQKASPNSKRSRKES